MLSSQELIQVSFGCSLYKTLCGLWCQVGADTTDTSCQRLFTQLLHYVAHITLWCRWEFCRPSSSESEGSLRVSPGIWKPTSCVWLWTCCPLSQHHTRLYEFAEAVSQCSEPSWHWCVLAVFHCYIRSHRSIPMLFNALHDVRHTCKWLWHLNSDAVTGIINIHMKSFPGQFLALAYIVFPVFPDHLEIDSTNWTITVASLTQLMLSQSWANHISISRWKLDVWNRTVVYLMRSQL